MSVPQTAAEFRAYMDSRPLSIELQIEEIIELALHEVWPDGDAPDVITADAVKAQMGDHPNAIGVLRDWNLPIEITIRVDQPNPHWSPAPPLIPELAPQPRIVTKAVVR